MEHILIVAFIFIIILCIINYFFEIPGKIKVAVNLLLLAVFIFWLFKYNNILR